MLAAEAGHYDAVELLLQHHADTDEQNLVHCRPLFAILHYFSKLVQSLLCLFVSFFCVFCHVFYCSCCIRAYKTDDDDDDNDDDYSQFQSVIPPC